jgi:hypothetical protein
MTIKATPTPGSRLLTPRDHLLVMIDYQSQMSFATKSIDAVELRTNAALVSNVSPVRADEFVKDFVAFSHGKVVSDNSTEPGLEIGRPGDHFRLIKIESAFGRAAVYVTDGHLPYHYWNEMTCYGTKDLPATLDKAKTVGVTVLVAPYTSGNRESAIVKFPGGYIAEIHQELSH